MTEATATPKPADAAVRDIDAATLARWLEDDAALLIDVREPCEHANARIAGSRLEPLTDLDPAALARRLAAAPGQRAVLYCRSGNRSRQAGQRLLAAGASVVYHLDGGLAAWVGGGRPTEADARPPLDILRQVQIVVGSAVLLGVALGATVSPWFLGLSAFMGGGLVVAGATGTCGMATLLARLPWNRRARAPAAAGAAAGATAEPTGSCSAGACAR